jgi:hypothetical protein
MAKEARSADYLADNRLVHSRFQAISITHSLWFKSGSENEMVMRIFLQPYPI